MNDGKLRPPIGVFDSGVGGLTVVAALRRLLPSEDIFYIGDTARVPYGGKSKATVERYSVEIAGMLLAEGARMLVVACNTSSALALPRLKELFRAPVQGVIIPGAQAAVNASRTGRIGVVGTRATVASGAYERAIQALRPEAQVFSIACPLLVPVIEEGLFDDPITDQILERYLDQLRPFDIDALVLGCTHYPLLRKAFARIAGEEIVLVDSAENCAIAVKNLLAKEESETLPRGSGQLRVVLTDATEGFLQTARKALALDISSVESRSVQG